MNSNSIRGQDSSLKLQLNDLFVLKNLESNLLDELRSFYERERTISDDLLESLHFVYKNPLFEALNQIDKYFAAENDSSSCAQPPPPPQPQPQPQPHHPQQQQQQQAKKPNHLVTLIKCDDSMSNGILRPHLFQVKGSMDVNYYLFDELTFCACSSFKFNVLGGRGDYLYCKHIVMVKLLVAMRRVDEKTVCDAEMSELIRQIQ